MKTRSFFLSFFLVLLVGSLSSQELMKNGNLEKWRKYSQGENAIPNGFRAGSVDGVCFYQAEGRNGGSALEINNPARDSKNRLITPPIDFDRTGAGTYVLSFYTKGTGRLRWVNLSKSFSSVTDAYLVDENREFTSDDWEKHEIEFVVRDTSVDYYLFFLVNNTSKNDPVVIDDISLRKKK